ncbi:uncharacterized protein LOC131683969 [Topomyia yanbarensis]|uniref:uncharacterized protein LOC131683969 n=1 Tax=Topomyia yanbarensis TaxID=2498891 RepID=UPI00273CD9C7|nr:uncharacterized protein LOC131683969 [Topomyia yanbarensis]
MAFNKDEMHAPVWLNERFFETILKQSEKDASIVITDCKIVPGSRLGDHFASIIFRANIAYQSRGTKNNEISLIVKTIPEDDGVKRDLLKNGEVFETETIMYTTVVPEMHRLFRSVGDDTELGPRLLYSSKEPNLVMVFEDLTKRNYDTKSNQLDLQEAKIAYSKLAKWHAASMHLVNTIPIITKLDKDIITISNDTFNKIWDNNIAILAKVCREWPGYEAYGDRVDNLRKGICSKTKDIYKFSESTLYNVLNHGDFHYKNMMYKIIEGKTQDIFLLDYQLSIWGTPAIDIIYSLYLMCSAETRNNHRDELIKFYYDEFVASLNKFGYLGKIPSLINLHVEILKNGHLEVFLASTFLPFMMVPTEEMVGEQMNKNSDEGIELFDMNNPEKMAEMLLASYRNPKYAAAMQKCLPVFLHKGLLDL